MNRSIKSIYKIRGIQILERISLFVSYTIKKITKISSHSSFIVFTHILLGRTHLQYINQFIHIKSILCHFKIFHFQERSKFCIFMRFSNYRVTHKGFDFKDRWPKTSHKSCKRNGRRFSLYLLCNPFRPLFRYLLRVRELLQFYHFDWIKISSFVVEVASFVQVILSPKLYVFK